MLRKNVIAALAKIGIDRIPEKVVDHLEGELQTEIDDLIRRRVTGPTVARAFALAFGAPVPRTGGKARTGTSD